MYAINILIYLYINTFLFDIDRLIRSRSFFIILKFFDYTQKKKKKL